MALIGAAVRIRNITWPQRESVMMLAGQHHITRAYLLEQRGPLVRLPLPHLLVENRDEVQISEVLAIGFDMVFPGRSAFQTNGVEIPLRVRIFIEPLRAIHLSELAGGRGPCRNRVETPMDKDAKLGVFEPLRHDVPFDRIPGGLILRGWSLRLRLCGQTKP